MQNYFTKILEDDLKALIKPQYVDQIPKAVRGTVQQLLDKKDESKNQIGICKMLGKNNHYWRDNEEWVLEGKRGFIFHKWNKRNVIFYCFYSYDFLTLWF